MKVRNVSPLGDLYVVALGREVKADEVVSTTKAIGDELVEQGIFVEHVKEGQQ